MVCIYCTGKTEVSNSRPQKRLNYIWRRRKCQACGAVFSTQEQPLLEDGWRVQANNGALVPFLKNKLFLSVHKSCEHRTHSIMAATSLTDTIISQLSTQTADGLLTPDTIVATTLKVLKNFDLVAATHYQAFHS